MKNSLLVICFLFTLITKAQTPQVSLNLDWEIPFTFANQAMTIEHDQLNRDYIYVAGKEAGLLIYDISGTPNKVKTITKNQFDTLDVMSVTQSGNYLYIALGNSFTNGQYSGMAIVDISTPTTAVITDLWKKTSGSKTGGGQVKVEGNYAYLGAMSGFFISSLGYKWHLGTLDFGINKSVPEALRSQSKSERNTQRALKIHGSL